MDSLTISLIIFGASVLYAFIAGLITRNYSQVDRIWSILPGVYVLVWLPDYIDNIRYIIPAIIVILWCIRLSTNFALKGGFNFSLEKGFYEEDYRWPILKEKIPNRFLFELFNLGFISFYQLGQVFLFTLPLYFYGKVTGPITTVEIVLFTLHALFLLMETVADAQQMRYYNRRYSPEYKDDPRYGLGFNTFGLWKYSRHPNYVFELLQWITVSFYMHVSVGGFHWTGIGAILLVTLFVGSTIFAEKITASKYPAYTDWKKATPPWIPLTLPFRMKQRREFREKYNLSSF